jgi:hypothetical protein
LHRGELASFVPKVIAIRRAIGEQTGIELEQVVPVAQIPKTTSGKLQRYMLVQAFERGEFDPVMVQLAALMAPDPEPAPADAESGSTVVRLLRICQRVVPDRQITPTMNLLENNLNSLTLARIHEAIELEFPGRIEVTDLFDQPTLDLLARFLDGRKG